MALATREPEYYTATRKLKIAGRCYDRGDRVAVAVVAGLARAGALLSRRWLIPHPDPNVGRTAGHVPQPTDIRPFVGKHGKKA